MCLGEEARRLAALKKAGVPFEIAARHHLCYRGALLIWGFL
mgnify:CR=1 FL=1